MLTMLPDQQEVLVAIAVAVIAPAIPALIGVAPRWLALIGVCGAVVLWLMLTVPAPSGDRDITKAEYGVLYAGVVLLWFGVWIASAFLTVSLRNAIRSDEREGPARGKTAP
jgi:hypothetical protein